MVKSGNSRRSWHVRANALVFGYAALGLVALVAPMDFRNHRWLVVHLFLLGSVTNCIVTWTEHFAVTLLRVPQPSRRGSAWRLVALNLSILTSLLGVSIGSSALVILGAGALAIVIAIHAYNLSRLSRRALQNRFAGTVHFYLAGAACLVIGIVFGAVSAFQKEGSNLRDSLHAGHLHANLLGWVGVTVIGTFFTFWPTILRTKMVDGVMTNAKRALPFLLGGICVAATALAFDRRLLAIVGMGLYAIGLTIAALPFVSTWRQKSPYDLSTFAVAFAACWFAFGILADIVALALLPSLSDYAGWLDRFIPVFLIGFAGQLLIGALTFLVPVILGGGPSSVRKHIERLSALWQVRLLILNFAALLVILGGDLAQIGYALFTFTLVIFIALIVYTVWTSARGADDPRTVLN